MEKQKKKPTLPKYTKQIERLMGIAKILKSQTGESHPLTFENINQKLSPDLRCDRGTFYDAINVLTEKCRFDIRRKYFMGSEVAGKRKRMYGYYLVPTSLDYGEARFLLDAVQSAAFITDEQTKSLSENILTLANMQDLAPIWERTIVPFDNIKHGNCSVIDSIADIDRALDENLKITFRYHSTDFSGNDIDKGEKCVNPLGLIFNSGYYYLCCAYNENKIFSYRLDRMTEIEVQEDQPISVSQEFIDKFRTGEHKNRLIAFNMWGGKLEKVTMRFPNDYAEEIMDRFGRTAEYKSYSETHFDVTAGVFLSPIFFGWCAGYSNVLEIIEPIDVRKEFIEYLNKALSVYKMKEER